VKKRTVTYFNMKSTPTKNIKYNKIIQKICRKREEKKHRQLKQDVQAIQKTPDRIWKSNQRDDKEMEKKNRMLTVNCLANKEIRENTIIG